MSYFFAGLVMVVGILVVFAAKSYAHPCACRS